MKIRLAAFISLFLFAVPVAAQVAISPRAFGWKTWREPVANAAALPSSGNRNGDCRVLLDGGGVRCWVNGIWSSTDTDTTCLSPGVQCNFAGASSEGGAATSALALASDPSPCPTGEFVTDLSAAGALTCDEPPAGGGGGGFNPAGVSGGQSITGGTGSGEALELRSTSHTTKGAVRIMDDPHFPSVRNWNRMLLGSSTCSNGNCPDGVAIYTATDGSPFPILKLRAPNGASNVLMEAFSFVIPDTITPTTWVDSGRIAVKDSGFFGISQFNTSNPGNTDVRLYRAAAGRFSIKTSDGTTDGGLRLGYLDFAPVESPPTCVAGRVYSDTSSALCWCDGAAWVKVVGSGTCS